MVLAACSSSGGKTKTISGASGTTEETVAVALAPAAPGVAAQVAPPQVTLSAAERRRYGKFRTEGKAAPLVVLTYHDVQPMPIPPYTVTPTQLAGHLAVLRAAGFTPVSASQVVAWLDGHHPLPPRSVLLTFDDSTKGTWIYGDPILAANKFRAVSFVITGSVGIHQPYYLTWEELRRMFDSGRWDLESHTKLAHQQLATNAAGDKGPALINRLWLPDQRRSETLDEFTDRVRNDLTGSNADLTAHGFPAPTLFAYPYSAILAPTNDPDAPQRTMQFVHDLFAIAFVDGRTTVRNAPSDVRKRTLRRLDVGTSTTNDDLFNLVSSSTPSKLRASGPMGVSHGGSEVVPVG